MQYRNNVNCVIFLINSRETNASYAKGWLTGNAPCNTKNHSKLKRKSSYANFASVVQVVAGLSCLVARTN